MTDEEEYDDEEEDDEELTDEERKKRRRLRELKEQAKKFLEKSSHGKIPEGFMGAYSGQENAHKYYRHHDFKFTAEPKDKVPEVKPGAVSGERYTEPQRWYPHSQPTENPTKNDESGASDKLFGFMERLSEDERREVWNIFYEQTGLEDITEDELARIESEVRLDFTLETPPLEEMPEPSSTEVNKIMPTDYTFIEDPIERSDADIVRNDTLRKLGHGPGKCLPASEFDDEEVY